MTEFRWGDQQLTHTMEYVKSDPRTGVALPVAPDTFDHAVRHDSSRVFPAPSTTAAVHGEMREALNCSIFYTDIAGFGDHRRNDEDRCVMRNALYRILRQAFEGSAVPWNACRHHDRGDGTLSVAPPTVPTRSLVEPLLALLAATLRGYNRQAGDPVRMRLRAALHVGPVLVDAYGQSGHALIHAVRMLDAPVVRDALATTGADLAFIASGHVFHTVVRHISGLVDPATFREITFESKESTITGWLHLAGVGPPTA